MKIYGLIGNPLTHSFSQQYFRKKFERLSIADSDYLNFEIDNLLQEVFSLKQNKDIRGLNVTIPYKTDIIAYLDELTPAVKKINACNCIYIESDKWIGYNTDIIGFERSFVPRLKSHHKRALILGTGGSSKAVAYVLEQKGIDYLFVSRKTRGDSEVPYSSLPALFSDYTIIINTTPAGMFPHVDEAPAIPFQLLSPRHYCYDLIYNPEKTKFLQLAAANGALIKNGSDMLRVQAEESWNIWNNNY